MTDYDIHPVELADRIKELEVALKLNQDLDEISVGVIAKQADRIEELEAQLDKAEAVLQGIVDLGGTMGSALYAETVDRAARAAIAELKGQNDE